MSQPIALKIYPEYAYVLLCVVATAALHVWQMLQVRNHSAMKKSYFLFCFMIPPLCLGWKDAQAS